MLFQEAEKKTATERYKLLKNNSERLRVVEPQSPRPSPSTHQATHPSKTPTRPKYASGFLNRYGLVGIQFKYLCFNLKCTCHTVFQTSTTLNSNLLSLLRSTFEEHSREPPSKRLRLNTGEEAPIGD